MFSIKHLTRRLLRQGFLSASIIIGIALAVALGVAAPLATNALAELGLRATLRALPRASQNIQLTRSGQGFNPAFQQRVRRGLGDLLAGDYTVSYTPVVSGLRAAPPQETTLRLRTQGGLLEHIDVTGRAPAPQSRQVGPRDAGCDTTPPIEALLSAAQLRRNFLSVGDQLCVANLLPLKIVGSFVPKNVDDPYWFDDRRPVDGELTSGGLGAGTPIAVAMLAAEDWPYAARFFNTSATVHIYRGLTRPETIGVANVGDADNRLREFRTQMVAVQPRPALLTGLDRAIGTFNNRFRLLQSSLLTLVLGVVTLAVVYVVLVGALATEQQSAEMAVLRSRGGSGLQVWGSQIVQSIVLAVPGLLLGGVLGALAVLLLRQTALFRVLGGQEAFRLRLDLPSLLPAAAILLLVITGLVLVARPALAQSLVTLRQERARPPRRMGWSRIQVDALLLFLAALGWWQLRRYGGSLTTTLEGRTQFNLLLLAAPILMLVAGALLFLRLFPSLVRFFGWLLARRRGLVSALSAWQLARNPVVYGRLVLLLTLTVGLGVYSQAVSATIVHEQVRQALNEAGADVRIPLKAGDDPDALARAYPASASTLLTRVDADLLAKTRDEERTAGAVSVLGVDGTALSAVLQQSGGDDATLLAELRTLGAGTAPLLGQPLPPGTQAVEAKVKGPAEGLTIFVKFAAPNGTRQVPLGRPSADWQPLRAAVPTDLQSPIMLQSLIVLPDKDRSGTSERGIYFDDIRALAASNNVMLDDFRAMSGWEAVSGAADNVDVFGDVSAGRDFSQSARLSFGSLVPGEWAALRVRRPIAIPALLAGTGGAQVKPGQRLLLDVDNRRFELEVTARIPRLPGTDDRLAVLLADRSRLTSYLSYGLPITLAPNELRLALRPGATPQAAGAAPRDAATKQAALVAQAADPLGNGVRVILLLGFACAVVLSILGFLTYTALSIRARQIDWAVLRALGIGPGELLLLIAAEQGFVLAGGVIAGGAVGLLLALTTGPFLQIVTQSLARTAVVIDWSGLLIITGGLILALCLALLGLLLTAQRRGAIRALRLGET